MKAWDLGNEKKMATGLFQEIRYGLLYVFFPPFAIVFLPRVDEEMLHYLQAPEVLNPTFNFRRCGFPSMVSHTTRTSVNMDEDFLRSWVPVGAFSCKV